MSTLVQAAHCLGAPYKGMHLTVLPVVIAGEADMDKHTKKVHAHLMKSPLLQSASIGARPTT